MAGRLGLRVEESKGWLSRTFVLRGEYDALFKMHVSVSEHIEAIRRKKS